YVALSYVWGGSSNEETGFPRVVEDALQVCKELGYKYLWVDQYCIDQNNLGEKMQQIANMHLVYQCAQLTIMAAAGTDASYGLPGVSLDRTPTSSIKIGAIELLAVPRDPHESIKRSRWWERGWTYQEGVMSRRRLFFTEDQIYYECGGMVGYECFQLPDDLFHVASLLYQLPSFILDYTENTEMRTQRLFYHTENYSRRKLSFDTDSLNAFKGIL
ncbi:HET-domain-containing protein, partial [Thozetella sp. PMI_491]